jgi:hypothetical protein
MTSDSTDVLPRLGLELTNDDASPFEVKSNLGVKEHMTFRIVDKAGSQIVCLPWKLLSSFSEQEEPNEICVIPPKNSWHGMVFISVLLDKREHTNASLLPGEYFVSCTFDYAGSKAESAPQSFVIASPLPQEPGKHGLPVDALDK